MPRRVLMGTLVTRCQQRADLENENHISPEEWKALISEQYGDLFSVVAATGLRYFEASYTITTTGAASYDEPADHLGTISVMRFVDPTGLGAKYMLREIAPLEEARWSGASGDAVGYNFVDDQIYLYPTPPAGQTYVVKYVPQATDVSAFADDAPVDLVTPDGETFLIWGVAVKALAKAKEDAQLALAERELARDRLAKWAVLRAFATARRQVIEDDYFDSNPQDLEGSWRFR